MATFQQERSMAEDRKGICKPFRQVEGNCDGWVSWWLRSRLQGKEIWRDKYFETMHNLALYPDETLRHVAVDHYETLRHVAVDPYSESTKKLAQLPVRTDRGLEKARQLQGLFFGKTVDRQYITEGIHSDKLERADRQIAEFVEESRTQPISDQATRDDNANSICNSFKLVLSRQWVAKYSVTATTAHALGLDCLHSPRIHYFDPNLGEFLFWSVEAFIDWWRACYQDRKNGEGAFTIMQYMFRAEFYRRL
jgi:hypothetical protein